MEVVYYPDMYLTSERLLKQVLLCWGSVMTIMPPTQKQYFDAYLRGEVTDEVNFPIERYKAIYDIAGERLVDALEITDSERVAASEKMLNLLTKWNSDTHFYDSLKIRSIDDLIGKEVEWYWFLHEKIEWPLTQLMLEENLVVNWSPGEIIGFQEVGKSYMSVIASELKTRRDLRLITDDEYYMAAKGPASLIADAPEGGYQLVSLAIPKVFFSEHILDDLSWQQVCRIREDLLPYASEYYASVEGYQQEINKLACADRPDEAFDKFCEFCERVTASFRPFAKEARKLMREGR